MPVAVSLLPEKLPTPEDEELQRKQARLAELEAQLADRELELASCLADLVHFEKCYLQKVGRRYAQLDELKARIAEARAKNNPHRQDVRDQARQARSQAQESARAAGQENTGAPFLDDPSSVEKPARSESLRNLYRQAAKLLHPDLTLDGAEKEKRHRLMGDLNDAYARGDEERIRTILREWHASPENVSGDGPGAELVRVIRKIAQVEKRLRTIADEMEQVRQGELFKLKQQIQEAHANGRDLLKDLGEQVDREIVEARGELKRATSLGRPMSDQGTPKNGNLVTAGRRDLAPVSAVNSLVSRGLADLAQGGLLKVGHTVRLDVAKARSHYLRGMDWMEQDEYDKAIKEFDEAIRLDRAYVSAHVERGNALIFKKDFGNGIRAINQAIRLDPNNGFAFYNRAWAWWEMEGWSARATADLDEAIRFDPSVAAWFHVRGANWFRAQDCDKAIKDFDQAIRLDPNNPFTYRSRGNAWRVKADYDKAIQDFAEAIRLDSSYRSAYGDRSLAWLGKKEFDKAIKDLEQVIVLRPKDVWALCWIARILATCPDDRVRDGNRAIQIATKACELTNWEAAWELDILAAAYAEADQFDEAERWQTKALERPVYQGPDRALAATVMAQRNESRQRLELYRQKKPLRQADFVLLFPRY